MVVGRSTELARLDRWVRRAEDGAAERLLVVGDIGMGRTSLLRQAARTADREGLRVVATAATPGWSEVAFTVVEDLLRAIPDEVARLPSDARAVLTGLGEGRAAPRSEVAHALLQLFVRLTQDSPTLLVLDDLERADEDSLAALTLLLDRARSLPLLTLAATRPHAVDPRIAGWPRLRLGPLSDADGARLLRHAVGERAVVDGAQAALISRALGGCPAAILAAPLVLTPDELEGRARLPDPVPLDERLALAWLEPLARLSTDARTALEVLCLVSTRRADYLYEVLRRITSQPPADLGATLEPAVLAGLLEPAPSGLPRPTGPLVRSAVLGALAPQRRSMLHRVAAEAAEELGLPPVVVITHLQAASTGPDEEVARCLARQAQRALDLDQPDVAATGWQAASRLEIDPDRRRRHAVEAARTWLCESTAATGGPQLLETLAAIQLDPAEEVWREWLRAEVLADKDLAQAATAAVVAARHAEASLPSLVPWLLWSSVSAAWRAGEAEEAHAAAHQLYCWCRMPSSPVDRRVPSWAAETLLGVSCLMLGRDPTMRGAGTRHLAAAASAAKAWSLGPGTSLSELINVVGLDEALRARGPVADVRLDELARRLMDDPRGTLSGVRIIQAARARRRGDWQVALARLREGLALARAVRANAEMLSGLASLVELEALTGEEEARRVHEAELRELACQVGDRQALDHADRAAGLAALVAGRPIEAAAHWRSLAQRPCLGRDLHDPVLGAMADLSEAAAHGGDLALARETVWALERLLPQWPDPSAPAALARARAQVAQHESGQEAALEPLREAVAGFALAGEVFEEARTRLLLGQALRRSRRTGLARGELLQAASAFARLGARPWERLAGEELGAAGGRAPPGDRMQRLTPQERRVAAAVARGATNRDVATALFLSPRTVEYHLSHVYRKLDVPGRGALIRLLSEHPKPPLG